MTVEVIAGGGEHGVIQMYSALSSDTKPTAGTIAFALLKETDTGDVYEYSGSAWQLISSGGEALVSVQSGGGAEKEVVDLDDDANGSFPYTNTSTNKLLTDIVTGLVAGDVIRIYAPTDMYFNFASDALETPPASSSSVYFAAGTELMTIPVSATHMNVVRVTVDGALNITKVL